jgi:hypothetical protein
MADLDFETRLERLFAQPPAIPDGVGFARRVEGRLDRSWAMRRYAITVAGLVGGLIAAVQLVGANMTQKMEGLGAAAWSDASHRLGVIAPQWKALSYLPMGQEMVWMGGALAVLAVALIATRSIEEI